MDRRHAITLIIISMTAIVIIVTGASYAYFSATFDVSKSSPINVLTPPTFPSFMATSSGSIDIDVEEYFMREYLADNETTDNSLIGNANLQIHLTSAKDNVISTCTYDIIFVWNDDSDFYESTPGALREFTISATSMTDAEAKKPLPNATGDKFEVTTSSVSETNIDRLNWQTKQVTEGKEPNAVTKTIRYAVIVDDAKISSAYYRNPTEVNWNFEIKFYNIKMNQDGLKDKKYAGVIKVDQDSIKC